MVTTVDRERAPDTWWSAQLGLIWSEDEGKTFRRVEDGRVVEFFHLPAHAHVLVDLSTGCCCGECA